MQAVVSILREAWTVVGEMAPYLLFGFLAAGFLSVFISAERVRRQLGEGWQAAWRAALWGVPMPLCSCSVIPVGLSLRRHGAGRAGTASFLLSAPQTGVDSILVTLAVLGPVFAVVRPMAALLTGAVGGWLVGRLSAAPEAEEEVKPCHEECCRPGGLATRTVRALRYGFLTLPGDVAPELLAGLLVAGAITVLVPEDFFVSFLGRGLLSKLVIMAVGIPLYVCATASVPIAAALILKGASPGAALVFLMTGPATNAASLAAYRRILGTRGLLAYLLVVAAAALLWGTALDYVAGTGDALQMVGWSRGMLPGWLRTASAVLLLVVLGGGLRERYRRHHEAAEG